MEFCRQYADEGWQVLACCRSPKTAVKLAEIPQVSIFPLDVSDFSQIDKLAAELKDTAIDVLINNAGIYGDTLGHDFGRLDYDAWLYTLKVNTQAPVKMAEAFLPHLKRSDKKLLVSITSQMGSIADNGSGGNILYRSSKAGLNAAMKSLAIDLEDRGIGVILFHPGWVKTDMGGPNALISAQTSVAGMRNMIERFSPAQSGCFLKYDGCILPW